MLPDFHQAGLSSDLDIKPSKVTIVFDCTQPAMSDCWQGLIGVALIETGHSFYGIERIPRVLRDDDGRIIGSINIT